jgi:TetR/AcrR family transcriptional repressor of nem operon
MPNSSRSTALRPRSIGIIDRSVHIKYSRAVVRPREFDRDEALDGATRAFWAKGYASTSTDDLLAAMNIGRQSLYNAFGDKRKLYLEALERYQRRSSANNLERLNSSASPLGGIEALLLGLVSEDDSVRALGCMGVSAVCEFGTADPELMMLRSKVGPRLLRRLVERIREGQACGEVDLAIDAREAAAFLQMTMQGIQLGARAGGDAKHLRALARFAIKRFKSR